MNTAMTRYKKTALKSTKFSLSSQGRSVTVAPDGSRVNAPSNSAAAPQNSAGAGGFGDDCSSGSDCGPGLDCVFGSCVGLPLPTVPPAFCGPGSHPSANSLGCECDAGYQDIGNGCVLIPAATGGAEAACTISGGSWDATRPNGTECLCPSGMDWNGSGCAGTPDTIEAACQAGGGTWDENSCQCAVAGQIFSNGQCGPGCFDSFGNPGDVDPATGTCVATQCAQGQGRGSQTEQCMDCGINGFKPDGIHCNECPPGSKLSADGNSCDCVGGKQWNADSTACVTGGTGTAPPPPPVKQPPVTTCAPGLEPASSAPGAPCTTPPPALKPAAASGGGGGVLALLAVAAVAAAALIATGGKKKKTARHARR